MLLYFAQKILYLNRPSKGCPDLFPLCQSFVPHNDMIGASNFFHFNLSHNFKFPDKKISQKDFWHFVEKWRRLKKVVLIEAGRLETKGSETKGSIKMKI